MTERRRTQEVQAHLLGITGHDLRTPISVVRVSLDVAYVENWSILRDVWIIAKTVIVVFARKGSY